MLLSLILDVEKSGSKDHTEFIDEDIYQNHSKRNKVVSDVSLGKRRGVCKTEG